MTTIGSPLGTFVSDFGSLKEILVDTTVTCPCCNGRLTLEKLTRLLDDVHKLAQARLSAPAAQSSATAVRHHRMIIHSHAHMISRTTDDYEAMANAGVVAVMMERAEPKSMRGTRRLPAAMLRSIQRDV